MTNNRPLEDWSKLIGDVPAANLFLDRFLQDAELIEITGRSYRLRGKHPDSKSAKRAHLRWRCKREHETTNIRNEPPTP